MPTLAPETLNAIAEFDTCTIANAIERFAKRLRNEGYTRPGLRCLAAQFPRFIGYAATCRVRTTDPPVNGASYEDRTDWWAEFNRQPLPRIAVIQDLAPGSGGSVVGGVHTAILKAFHCGGLITNGAVRDLPELIQLGLPILAAEVAVSHAYAHVVDYGQPVEIFGLEIQTGDLIYADCHGAISIPIEVAAEVPRVAAEIDENDKRIVRFCESPKFSVAGLMEMIK